MRDTELGVSVECGVVVSNRFVCRFEGEGWHGGLRGTNSVIFHRLRWKVKWTLMRKLIGFLDRQLLTSDSHFFRIVPPESATYCHESALYTF